MSGDEGCPTVLVTEEMMASFHTQIDEACALERRDPLLSGNGRKAAYAGTETR